MITHPKIARVNVLRHESSPKIKYKENIQSTHSFDRTNNQRINITKRSQFYRLFLSSIGYRKILLISPQNY
jgi:hypothetical protein